MDIFKNKLTMTTNVWSRIVNCRNNIETEIGFLGICEDKEHPLHITDLYMPKQICNPAHMDFDEDDVADYMADMMQKHQLEPSQTVRVWIHTHPGPNCTPSGEDKETFAEFIQGDWAIMAIVGSTNNLYAELGINHSLGKITQKIDWGIDYTSDAKATNIDAWLEEMKDKVEVEKAVEVKKGGGTYTVWKGGKKEVRQINGSKTLLSEREIIEEAAEEAEEYTMKMWKDYLEDQQSKLYKQAIAVKKNYDRLIEKEESIPLRLGQMCDAYREMIGLPHNNNVDDTIKMATEYKMPELLELAQQWKQYHDYVEEIEEQDEELEAALERAELEKEEQLRIKYNVT